MSYRFRFIVVLQSRTLQGHVVPSFWWNRLTRPTGGGKMGTIIGRSRKDGSKAFTAQIVTKKDGAIVHR
jgi:hypothetical protein